MEGRKKGCGSETGMPDQTIMIDGVQVPRFIYGTAWKKDETAHLVGLALEREFVASIPRISANIIMKLRSGAPSGRR